MFADLLKKRLTETGTSQAELARKIGVDRSSVHFWIVGRNFPQFSMIEKIAVALNCSPSYFIDSDQSDENILISLFRQISPDKRKLVLDMIRAALGRTEQ